MSDEWLFALLQMNPLVGDISGNMALLRAKWALAREEKADLVVTPELFVTGYAPQDFVLKPGHRKDVRDAVEALALETASGPSILLGAPWEEGGRLYNAALLLEGGRIAGRVFKAELPNYGPFDEKRLFSPAKRPEVISWRGHSLGVMICEDMWKDDVPRALVGQGAQAFVVLNASPYDSQKRAARLAAARRCAETARIGLAYVNQVGGQDELLFDGASFVLDGAGSLVARAAAWKEEILYVRTGRAGSTLSFERGALAPEKDALGATYDGLCVGVRDFVHKNGFKKTIIGLSGGIDSALVAALAVDALGADNVRLVMMPSPYTSTQSLDDAAYVAKRLECRLDTISIANLMKAFDFALAESFIGCAPDVTEENIQARCRGVLLMALANKSGALVLATGNKSEMAVGYATLYGDMCGAYAPLKDVYKTEVYKLAQLRNAERAPVFPESLFSKAPSAELRHGQKDEDSLPPYAVLDAILEALIEKDMSVSEIVAAGHDLATARRVCALLDGAEHKRRQAPPGPKITARHLGLDRRYPITNGYAAQWQPQKTG